MVLDKFIVALLLIVFVDSLIIAKESNQLLESKTEDLNTTDVQNDSNLSDIFDGVYTECFLHFSYICLQRKTLCYLKELNKLSEVPVLGEYVKFVKITGNESSSSQSSEFFEDENSEQLSFMIDEAVNQFFNSHIMKFNAISRNLSFSNTEEFVGRKKRKGGHGDGGGGHEEFFKKKMMMMGMMCMKMKFMMMMPAMMGMMGMMSFKGMMFSMMSFMLSKMMLLMKLLEKKGGFGGGGGADGGWAASGGGGGAWMPAGQDYGGGGGGYDANGQWQSRSILEMEDSNIGKKPVISYVVPNINYNNKPILALNKYESIKNTDNYTDKVKSRKKRGIIDVLQNTYLYWINSILGSGIKRRLNYPRYKLINGVKYVYYPNKTGHKLLTQFVPSNNNYIRNNEEFKPIIIADDFNKGESIEGAVVSRMNRKKFNKMKDTLNDTIEDNPWQ